MSFSQNNLLSVTGILFSSFVCLHSNQVSAQDGYLTGGDDPVSPELQLKLDERADRIRLGFNTKFLKKAGFSPERVGDVIIDAVDDLEEYNIPGMVIYVDSFAQENMPVAIGHSIVDPYKLETQWSTIYNLEELTGLMVTMPFLLSAIEQDELDLSETVREGVTLKSLIFHQNSWSDFETDFSNTFDYKGNSFSDFEIKDEAINSAVDQIKLDEESNNDSRFDFLLLGQKFSKELEAPILVYFCNEICQSLGMINTIPQPFIPSWRPSTAPGPYSEYLGRMAWGESHHPSVLAMNNDAAHGGLFSTADDVALYARFMIQSYHLGGGDLFSTETLRMTTMSYYHSKENEGYGMGWQTGVFGKKSFGWTTNSGRALWIDPETSTFCIILSNPEHPNGLKQNLKPLLNGYIRKLRQAVLLDSGTALLENKKDEDFRT